MTMPRSSYKEGNTSLTTSNATAPLLAPYTTLVQECGDRRVDVVTRTGLGFDGMHELKDELWVLCDCKKAGEAADDRQR
ncbi:hypothetical protein C8Q70DRAFT_1056578 [Cubamyces menziesii]|nr:hypothetical protein C8Q70DRAFT_1056578 [Cubamyces menziesii]